MQIQCKGQHDSHIYGGRLLRSLAAFGASKLAPGGSRHTYELCVVHRAVTNYSFFQVQPVWSQAIIDSSSSTACCEVCLRHENMCNFFQKIISRFKIPCKPTRLLYKPKWLEKCVFSLTVCVEGLSLFFSQVNLRAPLVHKHKLYEKASALYIT